MSKGIDVTVIAGSNRLPLFLLLSLLDSNELTDVQVWVGTASSKVFAHVCVHTLIIWTPNRAVYKQIIPNQKTSLLR